MKGLKELETLQMENRKIKYPLIPDYAMPRKKLSDSTANGLTQAILSWLELNGCWATRVSSAGRYIQSQGKFIPSTTKRGTADIHAVIGGRHVSIEVKVGKDRMSEDQHKVKAAIEKAGGVWFVVRSFDDFLKFYKSISK
jgi:hypothetical protein